MTTISDTQVTAVQDVPLINLFPLVQETDVTNFEHAINHNQMKGIGKIALKSNGTGIIPIMAKGEQPEDSWFSLLDDAEIAVVGAFPTIPTAPAGVQRMSDRPMKARGGNGEPYVTAMVAPVVTLAEASDAGHVVNDAFYSGKDVDAMIIIETGGAYFMAVADGPAVLDGWTGMEGTAVSITGTPLAEGRTGRQAVVASTALQGAAASTADLGDMNGYFNRVPKVRGMIVKDTDTGKFMVAMGAAPTDIWNPINSGTAITPA